MTNLERAEILRDRKRAIARQIKAQQLAAFEKTDATSKEALDAEFDRQARIEAGAIRTHRGFGVRTFRTAS